MGRLVYSLKDRYVFTGSMRRDGYSAFGQRNPRALFSSVALGWVFTEESFMKTDWLDFGKLRLSYGTNGNLSAVLEEYAHVCHESLGLVGHPPPLIWKPQQSGIDRCACVPV